LDPQPPTTNTLRGALDKFLLSVLFSMLKLKLVLTYIINIHSKLKNVIFLKENIKLSANRTGKTCIFIKHINLYLLKIILNRHCLRIY
jgi:hypothetical protein